MCGIFGYIGQGLLVSSFLDGLFRLEYRGYDSCGIAFIKDKRIFFKKQSGKISELKQVLKEQLFNKYQIGISHTRWATHGRPNKLNAHPHFDCKNKIIIVHNGIIENYLKLKESLIKEGHRFLSQTDSEVVAHLIEKFYKNCLEEAVFNTVKSLQGSFALAIISLNDANKLIGVRKNSPLIIGLNKDEKFLASDIPALLPFTRDIIYLKDDEIAVLEKNNVSIFNFNKKPIRFKVEKIDIKLEEAEKMGFEHFMLKEIFEQPDVISRIFSLYIKDDFINLAQLNLSVNFLSKLKNIFIIACGTAYHAGYIAKYFLEKYCKVNVEIDTSSEFRYREVNLSKKDLLIAISQSGETQDTLSAIRKAKNANTKVLGVCNVLGSSLVKETNSLIFTNAGLEIGVASTKAYTAQILTLILFSLYLAYIRNTISSSLFKDTILELKKIPQYYREILKNKGNIERISQEFSKFGCFLFLGRGINYPSALEGALKLKEISYIPAEGYPAGEMKHGPIALIDEYRGVICIAPLDDLYEKMVSNIQEIKARKGKVLSIVNYNDKEVVALSDEVIYIPQLKNQDLSPLLVAVILQLFAYYVARNLGREIDQPRNLAKSVTVE